MKVTIYTVSNYGVSKYFRVYHIQNVFRFQFLREMPFTNAGSICLFTDIDLTLPDILRHLYLEKDGHTLGKCTLQTLATYVYFIIWEIDNALYLNCYLIKFKYHCFLKVI